MSAQSNISGPGIGLPLNQFKYPSELAGAPVDVGTNYISLAPGDTIVLQAGTVDVNLGPGLFLQILDPQTGIWRDEYTNRQGPTPVPNDGFTRRIANLTGCPIAAVVTGGGSGYPASASCTAVSTGTGGSTWTPIIGGQLSVVSITNAGLNYAVPPLVIIPSPPQPGVVATAYAVLTAGSVSGITLTNVGAGYLSAPTATIVPAPNDLNYLSATTAITSASVTFGLTGAGVVSAAICTNNGAAVTTAPTITVTGTGGSGSTVIGVLLQTITAASISGAGVGYGTAAEITTIGGYNTNVEAYTNPAIEAKGFIPRRAMIGPATLVATSLTAVGTIVDGGLFVSAPTGIVNSNGVPTTGATVLLTLGSAPYTARIQSV